MSSRFRKVLFAQGDTEKTSYPSFIAEVRPWAKGAATDTRILSHSTEVGSVTLGGGKPLRLLSVKPDMGEGCVELRDAVPVAGQRRFMAVYAG